MVLGLALVASTVFQAVKTVVVPRATSSFITNVVFKSIRPLFRLLAQERREFAVRDRVLAYYAPIGLILLPGAWVGCVLLGFALTLWGTGLDPIGEAFAVSGSSLTTVGFARGEPGVQTAVSIVEAIIGLILIALLISYLPAIYSGFSRREVLVGMLAARAGAPPSPVELLARAGRIGGLDDVGPLFMRWEEWFTDIEESHTSLPMLAFFRSPRPDRNWVTAAGCILDTASLYVAVVEGSRPAARAQILIRTGYLALRRIADVFHVTYDADPAPDGPISVSRREFDLAWVELDAAGVPLKADKEQAWRDFAGWRVNYDAPLVALASLVIAPPGRWSGDRSAPAPRRLLRKRAAGR